MFAWSMWLKGLYAAAIGGVVASATNALADPSVMSRPKELAMMAGAGAAIGALGYLKTHPPVEPLPDALEPLAVAGIGIAAGKVAKKLPKPKR